MMRMKIIKITYQVLSGLSFILICGIFCFSFYFFTLGKAGGGTNHLSKKDLAFVLHHSGISTKQSYEPIYTYESGSGFSDDHLNYYCIQLEFSGLKTKNNWGDGPEKNEIFRRARSLAAHEGNSKKCFNSEIGSNSPEILAQIWSLNVTRSQILDGVIILLHKPTNRLLYVSINT